MAFSTSIYISALLAASAVMALPQIPPASSSTASSLPSASPKPVPTQDGIAANCDSFYWVDIGDSCWAITQSKGISLTDFYGWNPAVGVSCLCSTSARPLVCVIWKMLTSRAYTDGLQVDRRYVRVRACSDQGRSIAVAVTVTSASAGNFYWSRHPHPHTTGGGAKLQEISFRVLGRELLDYWAS